MGEPRNKTTPRDYLRDGAHLPAPLRDFHDQKDVFKSCEEWGGRMPLMGGPTDALDWMVRLSDTPLVQSATAKLMAQM